MRKYNDYKILDILQKKSIPFIVVGDKKKKLDIQNIIENKIYGWKMHSFE